MEFMTLPWWVVLYCTRKGGEWMMFEDFKTKHIALLEKEITGVLNADHIDDLIATNKRLSQDVAINLLQDYHESVVLPLISSLQRPHID